MVAGCQRPFRADRSGYVCPLGMTVRVACLVAPVISVGFEEGAETQLFAFAHERQQDPDVLGVEDKRRSGDDSDEGLDRVYDERMGVFTNHHVNVRVGVDDVLVKDAARDPPSESRFNEPLPRNWDGPAPEALDGVGTGAGGKAAGGRKTG